MSSNQEGAPRRAWVGKGKNVASRRWGVREKGSEQAQGFGGQEALVHLSHSRRSETNTFPEPRPSTAIFQAPRRALTGRHQLQEECLLCVVPLPQLPHDVAFPAGGRGPGTAGSSHRLSLPPAPSAPGPKQELAGRGGASRGLPDVRGGGRVGLRWGIPGLYQERIWGRTERDRHEKRPQGLHHRVPYKEFLPNWGLQLLSGVISRTPGQSLCGSFPHAYWCTPQAEPPGQCSLTP